MLFLIFLSFSLQALSLEQIFRADNAVRLNQLKVKEERELFLALLCEKQKKARKIPQACYEISKPADSWCLDLKAKDLNIKSIDSALRSSFLSSLCHKHLKEQRNLLVYRKKDFLLPELKNYWTGEKPFF